MQVFLKTVTRWDNRQMDEKPYILERYGRLRDMDRRLDIEYWQRLGPHAIFEATRPLR